MISSSEVMPLKACKIPSSSIEIIPCALASLKISVSVGDLLIISEYDQIIYSPNDIPASQEFSQSYRIGRLESTSDLSNTEGFYLVLKCQYKDPILIDKQYRQEFFFKWEGVKDGEANYELTSPFHDEIIKIKNLVELSS